MPHGVFDQVAEALYNRDILVLRTDGFMHTQSFSMQPPTNCHGSVPFPKFALYTHLSPKKLACRGTKRQKIGSLIIVDLSAPTGTRCLKAADFSSRMRHFVC